MHSRNPYFIAPDFEALAQAYPPLAKHIQNGSIDFHNDAAQRCLTQALLKRDFNIEIHLPQDRLCPPVPNRLNYILWIQDIVAGLRDVAPFVFGRTSGRRVVVRGLDIGTGASAIYPLLGCTLEPTWRFIATELDDRSYAHAQENVRSNGLSDRIQVVKVDARTPDLEILEEVNRVGEVHFGFDRLFSGNGHDGEIGPRSHIPETEMHAQLGTTAERRADPDAYTETEGVKEIEIQFTMCNPPFYSSAEDVARSEAGKEQSAFGVCTGAPVEMITPGGEARFVGAMVRESVGGTFTAKTVGGNGSLAEHDEKGKKRRRVDDAGTQPAEMASTSRTGSESIPLAAVLSQRTGIRAGPRWYTSMLGKMSSVIEVVDVFKELGISNYAITEFVQGHTRRWAVGWSVGAWRLSDDVARIPNPNPTLQRLLPARNTLRFTLDNVVGDVKERLQAVLSSVEDLTATVEEAGEAVGGASHGDTDEGSKHLECSFVVSAKRDTWSRGARRKRKRGEALAEGEVPPATFTPSEADPDPALICAIVVLSGGRAADIEMEVQWLYGWERALLESFASHVAKKVKS